MNRLYTNRLAINCVFITVKIYYKSTKCRPHYLHFYHPSRLSMTNNVQIQWLHPNNSGLTFIEIEKTNDQTNYYQIRHHNISNEKPLMRCISNVLTCLKIVVLKMYLFLFHVLITLFQFNIKVRNIIPSNVLLQAD